MCPCVLSCMYMFVYIRACLCVSQADLASALQLLEEQEAKHAQTLENVSA